MLIQQMKLLSLIFALGLFFFATIVRADDSSIFCLGADMSLSKFIEDHGVLYKDMGKDMDPLAILKNHGCNYIRLRLMVDPNGRDGQVNSLPYTLALAKQVKSEGLHLLLDIFYSDAWADPSHQPMPATWKGLSHPQLVEKVFNYTKDTLAEFRNAGCQPDMIEVGNEITNGMMWNDGGPISETKWDNLIDLIKAGIRGAHAVDPSGAIKIMIHIDRGNSSGVSHWFFDHLKKRDVSYDVIGLSYYPFWGGPLADLKKNMDSLADTYDKEIIVVETSFPWTGAKSKKLEFPVSPEGQKAYLSALLEDVASVPGGHGKGVFYWGSEWIEGSRWSGPKWSRDWEQRAFFDESGNVLPVVDAYEDFHLPVPQ